MKNRKMQNRFSILTAIVLILGLLAGSHPQLSFTSPAQAAQDPQPARGASAASDEPQSNQADEANRRARLEQKIATFKEQAKESGREDGVVRLIIG
ncbi:MAG: hypothetical protein L0Y75_06360, partial [Acidobacteria bacterium]|nr:hypothetical protein [Acidobacteriota bacterium]